MRTTFHKWVVLIVFGLALAACGPTQAVRQVTIDGRDTSGQIVDPVNLWDNYQSRSRRTGQAHHGEVVSLIRQDGAGCEVRTSTGAQGWVTCSNFIKEFK